VARPMLDGQVTLPPGFLKVDQYLQMDVVSRNDKMVEANSTGHVRR
jgi:hypothetical protein